MKCPKCGYLGFETSDRCRHCGYDFSLAASADAAAELPLHQASDDGGMPLADLTLGDAAVPPTERLEQPLDLDRVIGQTAPDDRAEPPRESRAHARTTPGTRSRTPTPAEGLPLFALDEGDDTPLITEPRPPRPPLAVRRTTPDVPRRRARPTPPAVQRDEDDAAPALVSVNVEEEEHTTPVIEPRRANGLELRPASRGARFGAMVLDLALLGVIDLIVVYLTLALAGLDFASLRILPTAPLAAFLLLLDGGYLFAFVGASGQTIGKMATGIRVMGDDGQRVDVRSAILRTLGCGASLLTAGLGYLPAFLSLDGRALQDRISGTRVVSAR